MVFHDEAERAATRFRRHGIDRANVTVTGEPDGHAGPTGLAPDTGSAYRIRVTPRGTAPTYGDAPTYEETVTGRNGTAHREAGRRADEIRLLLSECGIEVGEPPYQLQ
ncbi:MAG: hypothetical protein SVU88_02760 [Candidatus Nanohaloarchaea archaeon]|nr:hypothetical protein [Candidatus Nanohaloarchaea archaeon]